MTLPDGPVEARLCTRAGAQWLDSGTDDAPPRGIGILFNPKVISGPPADGPGVRRLPIEASYLSPHGLPFRSRSFLASALHILSALELTSGRPTEVIDQLASALEQGEAGVDTPLSLRRVGALCVLRSDVSTHTGRALLAGLESGSYSRQVLEFHGPSDLLAFEAVGRDFGHFLTSVTLHQADACLVQPTSVDRCRILVLADGRGILPSSLQARLSALVGQTPDSVMLLGLSAPDDAALATLARAMGMASLAFLPPASGDSGRLELLGRMVRFATQVVLAGSKVDAATMRVVKKGPAVVERLDCS